MANVTSLLTSLCDNFKNSASTSNSGTLPSQTVTNPRQQINAITTRSGKALEEPSIPLVPSPDVSKPQKEPEQNPETSTEKVQNPKLENTAHVPSSGEEDSIFIEIPKPKAKKTVNLDTYPSKLPYPERQKEEKHEIGLKDALVEMPKFNKWLSSLLRNKEKLEEIAITTVNAECSAIIHEQSIPEKTPKIRCKFLIPCALQELKRTSALADSGASINLLPHSIYKKLELEALTPTRMTLELANRSISHPMGIAEDVVVRVDGFTFLADLWKILRSIYHNSLHPSSSPVKTSDNIEKFTDELAPLDSLPSGNDDSTLKKEFHEKPKILSRPQEVEEIKEKEDEISRDVPINIIVMPIQITFDNPIDFNDHFSKLKDLKKDLPISFDSTTTSILPHPSLDSDSPFTAELSASVWICQKSLENSQKRTREWMSDQEAKEIEAKAREIMPQPSTKSTAASTVNLQSQHHSL
ncbi:reverse transcriptase domain-containing protein [Tanacetum coccineum]|uniref:Reverse transcriptase domain-containing protein n=1 Tax=Tanacetum coccineum TaxID=301880 RepID=A0ABQ4YZH7_9ASTR